jgi:hypothetical protein
MLLDDFRLSSVFTLSVLEIALRAVSMCCAATPSSSENCDTSAGSGQICATSGLQ